MSDFLKNSNQPLIQDHIPPNLCGDNIDYNASKDDGLSTIPIIISEERHLFRDNANCYVRMTIKCHDEIYESVSIDSSQIANTGKLINTFGMKPFADFGKNEWDAFIAYLCTQLSKIRQTKINEYIGWEKGSKSFVFGDNVIFQDHCERIKNTVAPRHIVVSSANENRICVRLHNHIAYLTAKNRYVGNIMICYILIAVIKQRIHEEKNIAPEFVLMLVGKTGSFKTSFANAFFNPMGLVGCSFADSEAAIRRTFQATESAVLLIDDFKCLTKENNAKVEMIIRMSGDIENAARRVSNGKVDSICVTSMAVITGEVEPHLQNSSYARIMFIDLNANPINKDCLDFFQRNQEIFNKFLIGFIQMIINEEHFDDNFSALFESLRNSFRHDMKYTGMHARYYDMYAWIISAWRYYLKYLGQNDLHVEDDFEEFLKSYIFKQHSYFDDNPIKMFRAGYMELKNRNMITVIDYNHLADANFDAMFEENGDKLFIKSNALYQQICQYWRDNGRDFPCSERKLRQLLKDTGLLCSQDGKLTKERKTKENKSISGYYIYYNLFKNYGGNNNVK
ncbi:MAG: hypothetical protein PUE13_08920 [Clostridiales bacterium]|nr:hypothetical protein [Clostridiales bacterium]